jgi:hypothetical protein
VPGYHIVGRVPLVQWEPTRRFAREVALERRPVVLRNAVPQTWPALRKWTPEYLADEVPTLAGVYQHSGRVFTFYDDSKPYGAFPAVKEDLGASHKLVL